MAETLQDSQLAELYRATARLQQWEAWLLDALPEAARGHVRLARLDARELVLVTDSPAWSSRIRYLSAQLQDRVERRSGKRPARVEVRVGTLPRREPPAPPRTLSSAAGATLERAAQHTDDPRLAAALARLARHANK